VPGKQFGEIRFQRMCTDNAVKRGSQERGEGERGPVLRWLGVRTARYICTASVRRGLLKLLSGSLRCRRE